MQRVIKFRGKRIDNGEWVYGSLFEEEPPLRCLSEKEKEKSKFVIMKSGFADWGLPRPMDECYVHPQTIGQYIGIKDDTGIEIYEGDIVRTSSDDDGEAISEVVWGGNEDYPAFDLSPSQNDECNSISYFQACGKIEVIGNIHESPELLKMKTNAQ